MSTKWETMETKATELYTETAAELYAKRATEARERLGRLLALLDPHAVRAARKPGDYGFAGDLGRLLEVLDEAAGAVGGSR